MELRFHASGWRWGRAPDEHCQDEIIVRINSGMKNSFYLTVIQATAGILVLHFLLKNLQRHPVQDPPARPVQIAAVEMPEMRTSLYDYANSLPAPMAPDESLLRNVDSADTITPVADSVVFPPPVDASGLSALAMTAKQESESIEDRVMNGAEVFDGVHGFEPGVQQLYDVAFPMTLGGKF